MRTSILVYLRPLIIPLLVAVSTAAVAQTDGNAVKESIVDAKWFQCRDDTDCILVPSACNSPAAINKISQKEYAAGQSQLAALVQCADPSPEVTAMLKTAYASCTSNICNIGFGTKNNRP
jgi:hypothetical protein